MHNILLFVLLTYSLSIVPVTHGCFIMKKWDVFVKNDIPDGIIVTHIKSKDDDLGSHTISYGESYRWSFCDRVYGTTLFSGYFSWSSHFQNLALYDKEIRRRCFVAKGGTEHCYWSLISVIDPFFSPSTTRYSIWRIMTKLPSV
ncbi:hypothetical protein LXL04_025396 [Taraxacum kok-saghyz]